MKLLTFRIAGGEPRVGLLSVQGVIDLHGKLDQTPRSIKQCLENFSVWHPLLQGLSSVQADYPLTEVELMAPVLRPGKIMALGLNYRDHAEEAGMELPTRQTWFSKASTSVNGPYAPVQLPSASDKLDYEAELAFVIGKRAKHVKAEAAAEVIAGYCCANDVSVRDFQFHGTQFVVGKSFDSHCPYGPWLTTADEIDDPQKLGIRCLVNGETRQDSNTSDMVFSVYEMVEYLSQAMTLEPGDLILTGTPAGVGAVRKPRLYLKAGDVVRVEIDQLGYIENMVTPEVIG